MSEYYSSVGEYFDEDAAEYEARYWANPVAQRIRQCFREEVTRVPFERALEVGCGIGLDLAHFARIYPERTFVGIDVSPRMVDIAAGRLADAQLGNASVLLASSDDVLMRFGPGAFDVGYVFFGALNTVEDLDRTADQLWSVLAPGSTLVLTFVNRWYIADMAIVAGKGRFRDAGRRLKRVWGGYSLERELTSRTVVPRDVTRAFGRQGELVRRRGISIAYPAWYRPDLARRLRRGAHWLWNLDGLLSRTPAWSLGEYTLYVYRKRSMSEG
jgi:SAM-dependent methyltransferase